MTNEERAAFLKHILDTIGTPKTLADAQDVSRLTGMGVEAYTQYLKDYGLGFYKTQDVMTIEPHSLDDFLEEVGVIDDIYPAQEVAALFCGPFGDCVLRTKSGGTILINAVLGSITIMKSDDAPSAVEFEIELVSEISMAIEAAPDEQLIGIDGKTLRTAAKKRLGPLEYGQCYGFFPTINSGGEFDAANLEIVPLVDHLVFLHTMQPFEIVEIGDPGDMFDDLDDDEPLE